MFLIIFGIFISVAYTFIECPFELFSTLHILFCDRHDTALGRHGSPRMISNKSGFHLEKIYNVIIASDMRGKENKVLVLTQLRGLTYNK